MTHSFPTRRSSELIEPDQAAARGQRIVEFGAVGGDHRRRYSAPAPSVDTKRAGRKGIGRRVTSRRSEEHTSELQSLMRISYAVFCLKKKNKHTNEPQTTTTT